MPWIHMNLDRNCWNTTFSYQYTDTKGQENNGINTIYRSGLSSHSMKTYIWQFVLLYTKTVLVI